MKKLIFILSALTIATLTACENNLDADLDNIEGVLCLNANLQTGADTNFVYVSRTTRTKPMVVSDARIELRVNGQLVETVTDCYRITRTNIYTSEQFSDYTGWTTVENRETVTDTIWGTYMLRSKFNVGDNVRVDVFSGGQHVWAEGVAPQKIEKPIIKHTYTHVSSDQNDASSKERTLLDVSFNDIGPDADYYRMSIYSEFYHEHCYFEQFFPYEKNLYELDSIVDYAKKNFETPIFKYDGYGFVDVYYLVKERPYWERGIKLVDYNYRGCQILSEGESQSQSNTDGDGSDVDLLMSDIKNTYHVFSDEKFSNSTVQLNVIVPCSGIIPSHISKMYDGRLTEEDMELTGDFYNWNLYVKLQSISEQQYYYLRAMNAVKSSFYDDMSSLTGAMKVPTNVHGGSGNFCVTTAIIVKVPVLENYRPPFYDTEPIYW